MEIVKCNTWQEVQTRRHDWLCIQDRSEVSIFSTYEFLESYWRNFSQFNHPKFGKSQKLNVLFIYDHGVPIGVLPLVVVTRVRKRFVAVKYLELLGQSFFTSKLDLICSKIESYQWDLILKWIERCIDFHVFNFQLVNEGSLLFSMIGEENLKQYSISPQIETSKHIDFENYKRNAMSKNFQKIFSNSLNRIKKTGKEYGFVWSRYHSDKHYPLVNLISESKKVDGKYNVFNFPEMQRFIEELYSTFEAKICILSLESSLLRIKFICIIKINACGSIYLFFVSSENSGRAF